MRRGDAFGDKCQIQVQESVQWSHQLELGKLKS